MIQEKNGDEPEEAGERQAEPEDASREVTHQHLEPGLDLAFPEPVELLDQPRAERAANHRAEDHRGAERPDDDTHREDGADDGSAKAVDHAAALGRDEQRDEVGDDRSDKSGVSDSGGRSEASEQAVRRPSRLDEEGGNDSPRDERGDVRHDHSREERSEFLDANPRAGRPRRGRR